MKMYVSFIQNVNEHKCGSNIKGEIKIEIKTEHALAKALLR